MRNVPRPFEYSYSIKTIDSHTMGEPTRIVYDGFPNIEGKNMMEKKQFLMENYDFLRKAVMLEPRGHRDMFGAILTEPVHAEADVGVIFTDSDGCLNMCGHGSIGTASMLVETRMVDVTEPYTEVVLDAPSGIIRTKVLVENGKAKEVSVLNVPSFLYKRDVKLNVPGWGDITFDISYGGSFFALVNADAIGLTLEMSNIDTITELGMVLRGMINKEMEIKHPYLDISTVDLVEFYGKTDNKKANMKNCVIFGNAQADRSPCGTGTSAKIATLYAKGELPLHTEFVYESITGSMFRAEATQEVDAGGYKGIIPQITGSAYITGINDWIIDEDDPLKDGFLLGLTKESKEKSLRNQIVETAWKMFRKYGYENTQVADIMQETGKPEQDFYLYFTGKDDLENTLGELFDQKYEDLILSMSPRITIYEKLLLLNQEMFRFIEEEVPFGLLSHVYMGEHEANQTLLNENRFYYILIKKLIKEGQKHGEFEEKDSAENIAEDYASLERGLIYDWCVKSAGFSLQEKGKKIIPGFLKTYIA